MSIPTDRPPDGTATSSEVTPAQIAAAWKKRGGFDSLRKQLLADFLTAPEKDKFLSDLDVSLPALLASTPSIARQDKKDRPAAVIRSMKQVETLKPQTKALEKRLRSDDEGLSRRIQAELRRSLCDLKGVPYVEEPRPEAPSTTALQVEAPVAPKEGASGGSGLAASGSNDSQSGTSAQPITTVGASSPLETSYREGGQPNTQPERSDLPKQEPESTAAGTPPTGKVSELSPHATMDVDLKPEPEEAAVDPPKAPLAGDADDDVDMKPVLAGSSC